MSADLMRVADDKGSAVGEGECGEVCIRGNHLFHGYLNNSEATRKTLTKDGWLRTGDIGAIDSGGNLRLLGRTHDMFKSGGYNVYPREIESVIEAMPEVGLCAVVSIPDELWQEVGVAFVQADPKKVRAEQIDVHCRRFLARYKIPKHVFVLAELPLLPIGKVDKKKLADIARENNDLN